MTAAVESQLQPGCRWRELASGRVIVILRREVYGTGPAWRYEDNGEPVNWHYCDELDFVLWGRFQFLPSGADQ